MKHKPNFRDSEKREIARIEERIDALRRKSNQLLQSGDYLKYCDLRSQIVHAERQLNNIYEHAGRRPLTELLTQEELMRLAPMMLEIHLICDLLTEATYELTDYCEKDLQIEGFYLMEPLIEARDRANEFASTLTKMGEKLCKLVCDNETLNAALRKKIQKHIAQRITKDDYGL